MTPSNDIEDEIRRQMEAERAAAGGPLQAPNGPVPPPNPQPVNPYAITPRQQKTQKRGLAGAAAALLAVLAKFKFLLIGLKLLTFGKLLLTAGSMLLSAYAYARIYGGWPIGVGIVLLIFIHECGHALAAHLRRCGTGIMLFIPFMGAFVTTKRYGRTIVEDAFIGIMGPIVGTLAAVACVGIYFLTGARFWLALADWGFLVNLFNLAPTAPLDGGWITPLFSPKLLAIGAVLLVFVARYNILIGILALLSIPRIIRAWKADPRTQPYYQVTGADRVRYAVAYLGLAAFLALSQYSITLFLNTPILPFA